MADTEHTSQIVCNFVLSLILAVHLVDELVECLNNRSHVDLIFLIHSLGNLISHITVDILTSGYEILLNTSQ